MPKVTVVIPSYNHGRFLPARLDSVLNQTYRDFEVLFLDDASTDDSLDVFARYRDRPRVRSVLNTVNGGSVFRQWNRGVREARGEYVWLAESDDVAEPNFLETLVPLLDGHPNVGLAYCNSLRIDEEGRVIGDLDSWTEPCHPTRWHSDFVSSGPDECRRYLARRNTLANASAVLFRKSLYEQVGYADESMRLCGDWAMWVKLLLVSDLAYVARPLNRWRVAHAGSVRRQASASMDAFEDHLTILSRIAAAGPLPPETIRVVSAETAWGWQDHAEQDAKAENPQRHRRVIRLAAAVGPEFHDALLAAVMSHSAAHRRWLKQHEQALIGLDKQVGELREATALSRRLQRLLLPSSSWRRRLLRSVLRLFRKGA